MQWKYRATVIERPLVAVEILAGTQFEPVAAVVVPWEAFAGGWQLLQVESELTTTLPIADSGEYCFMWRNLADYPAAYPIELTYQLR